MIEPFEDRIVVRPHERQTSTPSGLIIPEQAVQPAERGVVLAVGPGRFVEYTGSYVPTGVSVGETVLYSQYGGYHTKVDGEDVIVLHLRDVIGRVTGEEVTDGDVAEHR